jgi:Cellulase (glycosyl hydrolase family 5)
MLRRWLNTRGRFFFLPALTGLLLAVLAARYGEPTSAKEVRWSEQKAAFWYAKQPWLVGANYIPSDAINQLEMWQAATFNPSEIEHELGLAQAIGMNTVRVFMHDLLWEQDPEGYRRRIDQFLAIASRHSIKPIFVIFDSCWDPFPELGPQRKPIPGVHNSGWVQSPGERAVRDAQQIPRLNAYVRDLVAAFADDDRVLAWDVWNEPENPNLVAYGNVELKDKDAIVLKLLPQVFSWARQAHPSQPLTSGVWRGDWSSFAKMTPIEHIQIEQSDIVTFHNYGWPEEFEKRIKELQQFHRPIICTEYMARGAGSLIETILPIAKKYDVGAINWGLVAGKTQTYLPWDSWQRPYVTTSPSVWFHDIFYPNGKPYRTYEAEFIQSLTSRSVANGGSLANSGQRN